MTRRLSAASGEALLPALRAALSADGDALFAGDPAADLPASVPRRIALVVQSSGSTGKPKRVALSADALLASAAASDSALGAPGQWLLALPTTYIAGINVLLRSIVAGTDPVELGAGHFSAQRFVDAATLLDHPSRYTSLVPDQLQTLIRSDAALPVLRRFDRILLGGQAAPVALISRAIELGLNVTRTYGSSETSGGCVYDGVPIGTTEVRIVAGEVQLGGPVLAEGYLDDDERTDDRFIMDDGRRWYRTADGGDLVDGVLSVTGRLDDVIVSGGINVALGAVEALVRELSGVTDAVVTRAPDDRWGEVPVVVSSTAIDLREIKQAIVDHLGRAAVPARVVIVDALPMLSSGKPDRLSIQRTAAR